MKNILVYCWKVGGVCNATFVLLDAPNFNSFLGGEESEESPSRHPKPDCLDSLAMLRVERG